MAYSTYNVNEEITFKLMKRDRGSLLPIPVEECNRKVVTGLLSLNETDIDTTYSKLLLASPDDVMSIIQIERMELNSQLLDNEGCPEICFIEQALELLKEREESTRKSYEKETPKDEINPSLEGKVDEQQTTNDICEGLAYQFNATMSLREDDGFSRVRHESCGSDIEAINEEEHPNIAAEELEISNSTTTKPFYFYQASDGQHVYLHAMNIKMLELQYGALENCPHEIRGKILEKEGGSMTEGLRKRLRYLQHLPLTCQFEVAEINIASLVSDDILATFRGQIEARVKRRNRRAREELKREKKINEEVNMMWGRKPAPKLRIESHRQFPLCGSGSEEAFPVFPPPSPSESSVPSRSQSMTSLSSVESPTLESIFGAPTTSQVTKSLENGPSFAQMLKEGTSRDCKRDTLRTERKWAPPVIVDSEGELEGYLPAPDFSQSFSDAIAVALEKANSTQDDTLNKKKKKKKQKVLFVTGMACSAK
ncbi:hypothetical protein RUM44_008406 [Polyplax serrata]|uniref:Uncharacterized protein n=1 Tax=Polyplax serrata TaxID=468196 RepID=A0ABR1BCC8_POLSC